MLHARKWILAALACAALIAVAGTSAAQTAPRANDAVTEDTETVSRATSDATASAAASQRIIDYWTPERMQNALVPVLTKDTSGAVTTAMQSQTAATDWRMTGSSPSSTIPRLRGIFSTTTR